MTTTIDIPSDVAGADEQVEYIQGSPSDAWDWTHDLNAYPDPICFDSLDRRIVGDLEYVSPNRVIIHYSAPQSGRAYASV